MKSENKVLSDLVKLRNENIKDNQNSSLIYISTANMNPEKAGVDLQENVSLGKNGKKFYEGDILVSNIRPYFKKIWKADQEGISSADILNFIPIDEEQLDRTYLYYLLSNDRFFDYMTATAKGTKMPRGDKKAIKKYEIPSFTLSQQREIANILSAFDNKIENNNAIIANLEEQAQTIFKSWFVDFEPFQDGEFVDSEIGRIPSKWRIVKLKEISKEIVTGKTPPTKEPENYGDKMPFVTIPDMHNNVYVINTERSLSDKGIDTQKNKIVPKNSIAVSCIATVGLVTFISKDSQTNQQINTVITEDGISPYYVYNYLKTQYDYLNALGSSGSTTKNVNKTTFSNLKLIIPDENVLNNFHEVCEPIFEYILMLQKQNLKLSSIRDTLLPKLMSGEIRVDDVAIEKIVESKI